MAVSTFIGYTWADVKDAQAFAVEMHGDQKYGTHPYTVHTDSVARIMRIALTAVEADDQTLIAGICAGHLHDVLEDTHATYAQLVERFGAAVANAVRDVSAPPGLSRARRMKVLCAMLEDADELSVILKLADCVANLEASLGIYGGLGPDPCTNTAHPLNLQKAYMYASEIAMLNRARGGRGGYLWRILETYAKSAKTWTGLLAK